MSDEKLPQVPESEFTKHAGPGRPNKASKKRQSVREMVEELGYNPVKFCADLINGDYEVMGFKEQFTLRYDKEGIS